MIMSVNFELKITSLKWQSFSIYPTLFDTFSSVHCESKPSVLLVITMPVAVARPYSLHSSLVMCTIGGKYLFKVIVAFYSYQGDSASTLLNIDLAAKMVSSAPYEKHQLH